MLKSFFGKGILFIVITVLFTLGITKADTSIKNLFGMSCEVTRIPVSGFPNKTTFNPSQYTKELEILTKKGYNRIDLIKEFTYGNQTIKILLGEKCDSPVLRINQEESVNDIGVDHIEKQGNKLLMYGAKDGYATLISCDLETLIGNTYKPFDFPKQITSNKSGSIDDVTIDNINTSPVYQNLSYTKTNTPLVLEKKFIHPQDAFLLMRQPVSELIKFFGGNWQRDRKELATMLNISDYKGTKIQNIQIRNYLISYITIQIETTETLEIELQQREYQAVKQKVVSEIVKIRGYSWKYDRRALFQEIGGDISTYRGTKTQNIKIRNYLLTKIKPQKN